jgi:crotonobetainyl-CoA:carnitine CoA-transferase CaiB-like acyl-CoA transferase
MGNQALNWMTSGIVPRRVGNDGLFAALCRVLDIALDRDERFCSNPQRLRNRVELIKALEEITTQWDRDELFEQLENAGISAGPINELDQVFANPQVIARRMAIEREGRPGVASPIVIDGVLGRVSYRRGSSCSPLPGYPPSPHCRAELLRGSGSQ